MKISIFTHFTDPENRGDPWKEALSCYNQFADEVVTVGSNWQEEFKWSYIGEVFTEGFDNSKGDWVINLPIDMFIHENDFKTLRDTLISNSSFPAVVFKKYKFFHPERYEFKSTIILAINKKFFPKIKFNGGGDLCLPTLNSELLDSNNLPLCPVPIWNYDTTFRNREQIAQDRARFSRAWFREFGEYGDRGGPTDKEAFDAWYEMIKRRYAYHVNKLNLNDHPIFIKEKLYNLTSDQFGYDLFGLKNSIKFNKKALVNKYLNVFRNS